VEKKQVNVINGSVVIELGRGGEERRNEILLMM
jgi:hypothetical protein